VEIPIDYALALQPLGEGVPRNEWIMACYNGLTSAIYDGNTVLF
jgi:hypothetical protein